MTSVPEPTLHVAFFKHKLDNEPKPVLLPWARLAARLTQHERRAEKDGPLWSPAHYPPGAKRGNGSVLGVTAAVGDFDDGVAWEDISAALSAYEYVAHSTFSFTPEAPKFRVVIPFSVPVSRHDWPGIKARIDHHVFGLASDPAAKDASRIYYLPSCPPDALLFAEHHEGAFLDPRALPEVPSRERNAGTTDGPRIPLGKAALAFVANGALVGEQRSQAVAAARNYLSAGYSVDDTAGAVWRGLQASVQQDGRPPWTEGDAYQIATSIAESPAPFIELFPGREDDAGFRREGLGYIYEPSSAHVRFRADYINQRGDDITAEIVIDSSLPGIPTRLYRGRLNLCAPNSKRGLATDLAEMSRGAVPKETWRDLLEDLSQSIMESERAGEPFEAVGQLVKRRAEKPRYQIDRFIPSGKPTLLYGPGGVGKGWVAVSVCCAVQLGVPFAGLPSTQGNTLYLDWEDDRDTLDDRIKAVARGMGLAGPPRIGYRHCRVPLIHQINQLSRYIKEHCIVMAVVDSVGLAAGTAGERSSYEETALRFFDALRQIGAITWLCIDHVSEQGRQNTSGNSKAYGSVYKMNEARMAWEMKKDQEAGAAESHIGLYNTKCNHGPIQMPLGLDLDFSEDGAVSLSRHDVRDSDVLSQVLSETAKVRGALATGALTNSEIADFTHLDRDRVKNAVNRLVKRGLAVKFTDGRAGLRDRGSTRLPEVGEPEY